MYIPSWVIVLGIVALIVIAFAFLDSLGHLKKQLEDLQSSVDDLTDEEQEIEDADDH